MLKSCSFYRNAAIAFMCLELLGCAVVDRYSDRAAKYNIEAEQAQEKTILLNIVRASLRRPMQFTTISTISGTASATGSGGYSLPVNIPFRQSGGSGNYPAVTTWTLGGSVSGGETFTVPVLDTQEFYQGILKPIPLPYYDLLLQRGFPRDLLFNIFIDKIVVRNTQCLSTDHTENCETIFKNYVSDDEDVDQFQILAHYLLRMGWMTESFDKEKEQDRPLKHYQNYNVKLFGSLKLSGSSMQPEASGGGSQSAELPAKAFRPCFAPVKKFWDRTGESKSSCGASAEKRSPLGAASESQGTNSKLLVETARVPVKNKESGGYKLWNKLLEVFLPICDPNELPQKKICDQIKEDFARPYQSSPSNENVSTLFYTALSACNSLPETVDDRMRGEDHAEKLWGACNRMSLTDDISLPECFAPGGSQPFSVKMFCNTMIRFKGTVSFSASLRSTDGVIFYLGEVMRRQLYPDFPEEPHTSRAIMVSAPRGQNFALRPCRDNSANINKELHCDYVLLSHDDLLPQLTGTVSVMYDGRVYSVPDYQHNGGFSMTSLEIAKQLLALFSSSKALPQSNVLSVVNQ